MAKKRVIARSGKAGARGKSRAKKRDSAAKRRKTSRRKSSSRHVRVSLYGIAKLLNAVEEHGHSDALASKLPPAKKVVSLHFDAYKAIKEFVRSKPKLRAHALGQTLLASNCDPDDPYCIGFGSHSSMTG